MRAHRQFRSQSIFSFTEIGLAIFTFFLTLGFTSAAAEAQLQFEGVVGQGPGRDLEMGITFPNLGELFRPELLALFLFDCAVILGIAASIVYHPVRLRARVGADGTELPRLFLLYGLIGMAIGFLVLQNGALIGFVVFGIGGLLRFRSVMENSTDTVEVILVTLLGLCVGLNLQSMAILIAVASWVVIWRFGGKRTYQLSLKHPEGDALKRAIIRLEALMASVGWEHYRQMKTSDHISSSTSTASAAIFFSVSGKEETAQVEKKIYDLLAEEGVDWKLK